MIFKAPFFLFVFSVFLFFSGCAPYHVRGRVQSGRQALLLGRAQQALSHFKRAAEMDPRYVTDFSVFEESIWTYLGRAHYQLGELDKAREALERAREEHREDYLSHVYLGLVLMRQGQREDGMREAKLGLQALGAWLRDLDRYEPVGRYWDPGLALDGQIGNLVAMIEGGDAHWREVAHGLEWLGREFEEEMDRAKEDEILDWGEDAGDDDAPSP